MSITTSGTGTTHPPAPAGCRCGVGCWVDSMARDDEGKVDVRYKAWFLERLAVEGVKTV